MTSVRRHTPVGVFILAAAMAVACNQSDAPTSPSPSSPTSPVSVTYSTRFGPQGSASRLFTASRAGTVTVTLVEAGPPSTVALGLGLGIPRANGGGCALAVSVITTAGPTAQVSSAVDAGMYCVQVFAPGGLTDDVAVTVTLVHP